MNIKTKILIVFLLTLIIVVGGGGYYFYTLTHPTSFKGMFWYEFFADESQQNIEFVPNYYENSKKSSKITDVINKLLNQTDKTNRTRSRTSDSEESSSNGLDISFGESNLLKHSFNQQQSISSSYMGSNYAYKNNRKEDRLYGTLSSGLAYGNYTLRSSDSNTSDDNITSRNWAINGPLAVPFSNGHIGAPSTTSGIILFDPGVETKDRPIPVGEGCWIMLIMAVGYMRIKRKGQRLS